MNPTAQLLTAADLERMPSNGVRYELVSGELRAEPPAGVEHGAMTVKLTIPLAQHVLANQLGVILAAETGFLLARDPDTVRAADIAFVRQDRIPATGLPKAFWPGAPDLAVEVVSPGDTLNEVEEKVEAWLEAGSEQVWVVNPRRKTVTVYRSMTDLTVLTEKDELTGEPTVPGFRCPVKAIFG